MATIVAAIGILSTLFGVFGLLSPNAYRRFGELFRTNAALYGAGAIRLLVGLLLVVVGPYCRPDTPWVGWTVRIIGAMAIAVVVVVMLLGPERMRALSAWWLGRGARFLRGTALAQLLIGVFLIYAGT